MRPPIRQIFEPPQGSPNIAPRTHGLGKPMQWFPGYNQDDWISRGLGSLIPFWEGDGSPKDIVDKTTGIWQSTAPSWGGSSYGISYTGIIGTGIRLRFDNASRLPGESTLLCVVNINDDTGSARHVIGLESDPAGPTRTDWEVRHNSTFGFNDLRAGWRFFTLASGVVIPNFRDFIFICRRTGSTGNWKLEIFIEGVLVASDTTAQNPEASTANVRWVIGSDHVERMPLSVGWNRALTDLEIKLLSADPFSFMRPRISAAILGANVAAVGPKNYYVGGFANAQRNTRGLAGVL